MEGMPKPPYQPLRFVKVLIKTNVRLCLQTRLEAAEDVYQPPPVSPYVGLVWAGEQRAASGQYWPDGSV